MKRSLRILTTAFALVIVAGTIASAAPGLRAALEDVDPTETIAPEVETEDVAPEPVETESVDPETEVEAEDTDGETEVDGESGPDFSVCDGKTGLDNAICRHEVLLGGEASVDAESGDPSNDGLENSLAHLQGNQEKQQGDATETTDEGDSTEGDTTDVLDSADEASSCPGKSCEPHGNSGH